MFDLTDHQDGALAGLLQKRLEYSSLLFQCEIWSAPPSARRDSAIAYRLSSDDPISGS